MYKYLAVELVKWILFIFGIMGVSHRNKWSLRIGSMLIIVEFIVSMVVPVEEFHLSLIAAGIFIVFFMKNRITMNVFTLIGTIYIVCIVDIICYIVIPDQIQIQMSQFLQIKEDLLINSVGVMVWVILYLSCKRRNIILKEYVEVLSTNQRILLLFGILSSGMVIGMSQLFLEDGLTIQMKNVVFMVCVLEGIVMIVLSMVFMGLSRVKRELETEKRLLSNYIEQQKEYYLAAERQDYEIRKFKHDYKNHLLVLEKYIKREEVAKANDYIEKLTKTSNPEEYIDTGNSVVNAIVNYHMTNATKENIKLEWSGKLEEDCEIEDIDLCTIFSNIISNAVEGVARLEHTPLVIRLQVQKVKNMLFIIQSNGIEDIFKLHRGLPVTTKEDKNIHGLGLQNVKSVVERYSGGMKIHVGEEYRIEVSVGMASFRGRTNFRGR